MRSAIHGLQQVEEIARGDAKDPNSGRRDSATLAALAAKQRATEGDLRTRLRTLAPSIAAEESRVPVESQAVLESRLAEAEERLIKAEQALLAHRMAPEDEDARAYKTFIANKGSLYASLKLKQAHFQRAKDWTGEELRKMDIAPILAIVDKWPEVEAQVNTDIAALDAAAARFASLGGDASAMETIHALWKAVGQLARQVGATILREHHRRTDAAKNIQEFMKDQAKLLQWCRQQRATLEGIKDPEHIQEYVASFQSNVTVMENNFTVLMEMSDSLVPNLQVEKALVEALEVYLGLSIMAFEKLRSTLLDLHHRSSTEADCKQWTSYQPKVRQFLTDAEKLLQMPSDEESRKVTRPVLDACKSLVNDFEPHSVIAEHLADFSLREECLQEHYTAIRKTIFSKLSLSAQAFHGQHEYPRREEYMDRFAELNDWVECKGQSGSWKELLTHIHAIKGLLEQNEAAANDDR